LSQKNSCLRRIFSIGTDRIGYRAEGRKVVKSGEEYQLREQQASYIANSGHKKATLSDDNTYLWNVSALS
jgi:hypothetical protein